PVLDAAELLELLREDWNRGPCLHSRTHRLVQTSPESRKRAFIEARAHQDVELEVVFERLPLELLARHLGVLHDRANDQAEQQLLVLGRLCPCADEIVEAHPKAAAAEE